MNRIKVEPYTRIINWGGAWSAYGVKEHSFLLGFELPVLISISCRMFKFLAERDAKKWLKKEFKRG